VKVGSGDRRSVATPRGAVTIRLGSLEDAPAYRDLRLEALRNHPVAFSSDYETSVAKPMTYWTDRLRFDKPGDGVMLYFAVHEEQLIGMCGITYTDLPKLKQSAYIVSMYVRPEWRGLRIAEELVDACLDWGRAHDIKIVKLGVTTTNTPAILAYARCGFHVYGIEPEALRLDGVTYDELLMAQTI
jgi:RimJ/RimL family protein N-acetyltransferase